MIKEIQNNIKNISDIIDNLNKNMIKLEQSYMNEIQSLNERIEEIEEYLIMRSRGFYNRFRRK